ncbi:MAG TPA: hypothetical protein VHC63_10205 [Acidimicrobiales bacterium]|nr:hypothetical protein [Acidimicrobiales bacterium]
MTIAGLRELKASLDSLVVQPELFDGEFSTEQREAIDDAIQNFLTAGTEILAAVTPYLWQYRDSVKKATFATRARRKLRRADTEIWEEVRLVQRPTIDLGGTSLMPARSYVTFEGEVAWEPEHGLGLVFEDGRRVVKVGPYDGHATVAHAFGDPALLNVVFK